MDEKKLVDNTTKDINAVLDAFNMKDMKLNNITIRIGNRLVEYKAVSDKEYPIDKEIREEYQNIVNTNLKKIKEIITEKFNDALRNLQMAKDEFLRKEQLLLDKIKNSRPMPDVTIQHARKGLSIIKGERTGEIAWLVRRTYEPKTVDFVPIKEATRQKLVTPIYIMVTTVEDRVMSITTRKIGNLELFEHYHQAKPDCWGSWKWSHGWKTPEDIIKLADEATAVLQNINSGSAANNSPTGFPSLNTLRAQCSKEHAPRVVSEDDFVQREVVQRTGREGVSEDIWST